MHSHAGAWEREFCHSRTASGINYIDVLFIVIQIDWLLICSASFRTPHMRGKLQEKSLPKNPKISPRTSSKWQIISLAWRLWGEEGIENHPFNKSLLFPLFLRGESWIVMNLRITTLLFQRKLYLTGIGFTNTFLLFLRHERENAIVENYFYL